MDDFEAKEKRSISKIVIIMLLVLMMLMMAVTLFLIINQNQPSEAGGLSISSFFQTKSGEYTIPLEEFIINLKQEGNVRHYIRVTLALMYTDEERGPIIETNISKIRDTIISSLREKTYDDVLDNTKTEAIKNELIENINTILGEIVIKGVYITDVIVQ